MRYVPTIDLWNGNNLELLKSGHLKLQPGQWVYCGNPAGKSRFVGVRDTGTIWAAHYQAEPGRQNQQFRTMCKTINRK